MSDTYTSHQTGSTRNMQIVRLLSVCMVLPSIVWFPFGPDHFELPKAMLLIGFVCAGISVLCIYPPKNIRVDAVFCFLLCLLVCSHGLAFVTSIDTSLSLSGVAYRYGGFVTHLFLLLWTGLLYVYWSNVPRTQQDIFYVMYIYTIGIICVMACVSGIIPIGPFQMEYFDSRVFGLIGNPNTLALLTFLGILFVHRTATRHKKIFWYVLFSLTIILTGSKVVCGLLFLFFFILMVQSKKNLPYVAALFLCLLGAVVLAPRVFLLSLESESVRERLALYATAYTHVAEVPVFGFGQDTQSALLTMWDGQIHEGAIIDRFHSEIFEVLFTRGWFGLCVTAAFLVYTYVCAWRARMFTALLALVSIHMFVLVHFHTISTLVLYSVLVVFIHSSYLQYRRFLLL
mgnify:FL=1